MKESTLLKVNEIFFSIQGESTKAGLPCIFVRLTYCNLRCVYCDTEYAFEEGNLLSEEEIIRKVKSYNCNLVEVTGGEPLFQKESLSLMKKLCDENFEVLLETGGSLPIQEVDKRVKIILDLKTPSSKMERKNLYENLNFLKKDDEIKFVIGSEEDYLWAKNIVEEYNLPERFNVLFSSVFSKITHKAIVEWILRDKLNVRYQLQMHKFIWDPNEKGV